MKTAVRVYLSLTEQKREGDQKGIGRNAEERENTWKKKGQGVKRLRDNGRAKAKQKRR